MVGFVLNKDDGLVVAGVASEVVPACCVRVGDDGGLDGLDGLGGGFSCRFLCDDHGGLGSGSRGGRLARL